MKTRNPITRSPGTLSKLHAFKKASKLEDYSKQFVFDLEHEEILHETEHWVVIPNRFPYDNVFTKHNMIVPKRVFARENEMTVEELNDLEGLKDTLDAEYDGIMENLMGGRSVNKHYHLHLLRWKDRQ